MDFVDFSRIAVNEKIPTTQSLIALKSVVKSNHDQIQALKENLQLSDNLTERVNKQKELLNSFEALVESLRTKEDVITATVSKAEALLKQMETLKSSYEQSRVLEEQTLKTLQDKIAVAQQDLQKRISEANSQLTQTTQQVGVVANQSGEVAKRLTAISKDEEVVSKLRDKIQKVDDSLQKTFSEYSESGSKKTELDKVHEETKKRFAQASGTLKTFEEEAGKRLADLSEATEKKISEYCAKIESFFGGALAVGLGEAYHLKCQEEAVSCEVQTTHFNKSLIGFGILGTVVALGHVAVAVWSKQLPTIGMIQFTGALTIPLVVPLMWFALTSSRKANLAKRLAEEYAHKEVVSKTYEGLLRQIKAMGDTPDAKALLLKLLDNAVQVNEKNAGELIKGYNRPDHPILEVLERVNKLDKDGPFAKALVTYVSAKGKLV